MMKYLGIDFDFDNNDRVLLHSVPRGIMWLAGAEGILIVLTPLSRDLLLIGPFLYLGKRTSICGGTTRQLAGDTDLFLLRDGRRHSASNLLNFPCA